jgi:hypothetical protein
MSKREIPKAFFEPLEHIQASDLLDNEALLSMIKKETSLAIEEAFRNKKTFATLFEINGIGLYLDIPKQYWIPALEQCINFKLEEDVKNKINYFFTNYKNNTIGKWSKVYGFENKEFASKLYQSSLVPFSN